jgi:hypothetical protein
VVGIAVIALVVFGISYLAMRISRVRRPDRQQPADSAPPVRLPVTTRWPG